jgi:hypothetical protein
MNSIERKKLFAKRGLSGLVGGASIHQVFPAKKKKEFYLLGERTKLEKYLFERGQKLNKKSCNRKS